MFPQGQGALYALKPICQIVLRDYRNTTESLGERVLPNFHECFHTDSIAEHRAYLYYFFKKMPRRRKENKFVYFNHQNVNFSLLATSSRQQLLLVVLFLKSSASALARAQVFAENVITNIML